MFRTQLLTTHCLLLTLLASPTPALAQERSPMNLQQCFEASRDYATRVKVSAAAIREAQHLYEQALGNSLPIVSLQLSDFFQGEPGASGNGVPNTFVRTDRPEVALNVTLPTFRGFKEYQTLQGASSNEDYKRLQAQEVLRLLYYDVAGAYFTTVSAQNNYESLRKIAAVLKERQKELSRWVKLGKSRRSDLLIQETDLELLEGEMIQAQGNIRTSYALLSFLTGLNPQPPVSKPGPSSLAIKTLEQYLEKMSQRADVRAANEAVAVAEAERRLTRNDYFPGLDLSANYYFYRVGFQENIDWDATVKLSVPLFQWGTVGATKVATAKLKQSELQAIETLRLARNQVTNDFLNYQTTLEKLQKYEKAAEKAEKSYELEVTDYRRGLITNLEVIQTQRTWLEAVRSRNSAQTEHWLATVRLQVNAGELP